MHLTDTVTLAAQRDDVVAALTDPAVLQTCIPGCSAVSKLEGNRYEVQMSIPTGLRRMQVSGTVRLDMTEAPAVLTILRSGNGRADISLTEEGDTTVVTYDASAELGGKAAMLGAGMISGIGRRLIGSFFDKLAAHLKAG